MCFFFEVARQVPPRCLCPVSFVMYRSHGEPKKDVQQFSVDQRCTSASMREVNAGVDEGNSGRAKGRRKTLLFIAGDQHTDLGFFCMDEDEEKMTQTGWFKKKKKHRCG